MKILLSFCLGLLLVSPVGAEQYAIYSADCTTCQPVVQYAPMTITRSIPVTTYETRTIQVPVTSYVQQTEQVCAPMAVAAPVCAVAPMATYQATSKATPIRDRMDARRAKRASRKAQRMTVAVPMAPVMAAAPCTTCMGGLGMVAGGSGLAQQKAVAKANNGIRGHLNRNMGGYAAEGTGWGPTRQAAIEASCFWGERPVGEIGAAQGRDGVWYANVLYR